jgi:hypothetical protein
MSHFCNGHSINLQRSGENSDLPAKQKLASVFSGIIVAHSGRRFVWLLFRQGYRRHSEIHTHLNRPISARRLKDTAFSQRRRYERCCNVRTFAERTRTESSEKRSG